MRHDMFKVIVERPRRGGRAHDHHPVRAAKRFELDEELEVSDEYCVTKSSVRRPWNKGWNRKDLNENLNPLERFIEKSVGRPWSEVYSEICQNLSTGSTVHQHVRDHVRDYVDVHTYLGADGFVYCRGGNYVRRFFVDPTTGLVRKSNLDRSNWRLIFKLKRTAAELTMFYKGVYLFERDKRSELWFARETTALTVELLGKLQQVPRTEVPRYGNPKQVERVVGVTVYGPYGSRHELRTNGTELHTVYSALKWELERSYGSAIFVGPKRSVTTYELREVIEPHLAATRAKVAELEAKLEPQDA